MALPLPIPHPNITHDTRLTYALDVRPGTHEPRGAVWDGAGVNFAIHAPGASRVELCVFDRADATAERRRIALPERTDGTWHGYLPGAGPGLIYGYRVHGPWNPAAGLRFDPNKVLLDPYATVVARLPVWHDALASQARGSAPDSPLVPIDSAPFAPLGAVADPSFDWGDDRPPRTPWSETVIYEAHVKGVTALHPAIEPRLRGTYLGLASEPAITHLKALGITAVELLPIHQHADERRLVEQGLVNYWGYNTLSWFTPDVRFVTTGHPFDAAREFRTMVRTLHERGLEVILDVVYNHTMESDHTGPTVSWRGIDNRGAYWLQPGEPARYLDTTGCGHTVNAASPGMLRLIMDSLRYWVQEMHVDGFRFDLATALAREADGYDPDAGLLDAILQDPVLRGVKLIAEPWDLGADGYQVARFPAGFAEWNDRYRSTVRRFWRGDAGVLPELATRLAGSSDLYALAGRGPRASLNYVTAHDGFTLADLVAYEQKRNQDNLEDNRDGESNNESWNSGVEGPTTDAAILELRRRRRRSVLLTLLVSQGVPMISGGDELGRSQQGNNNAYCHDSPRSWTAWPDDDETRAFLSFVRRLVALRRDQPVLRRRRFLAGRAGGEADALWVKPEGGEFTDADWADASRRALGLLLDGDAIAEADAQGNRVTGETLLILFNAGAEEVEFLLPEHQDIRQWDCIVTTSAGPAPDGRAGSTWRLDASAAAVFRAGRGAGGSAGILAEAGAGPV
jgi:glycogen operon protein